MIHPKAQEALDLIQEAQNIMDTACQALSCVPYMATTWGSTCNLQRKIHAHWYKVKAGAERVERRQNEINKARILCVRKATSLQEQEVQGIRREAD
jgi:hypothetical protein